MIGVGANLKSELEAFLRGNQGQKIFVINFHVITYTLSTLYLVITLYFTLHYFILHLKVF